MRLRRNSDNFTIVKIFDSVCRNFCRIIFLRLNSHLFKREKHYIESGVVSNHCENEFLKINCEDYLLTVL